MHNGAILSFEIDGLKKQEYPTKMWISTLRRDPDRHPAVGLVGEEKSGFS